MKSRVKKAHAQLLETEPLSIHTKTGANGEEIKSETWAVPIHAIKNGEEMEKCSSCQDYVLDLPKLTQPTDRVLIRQKGDEEEVLIFPSESIQSWLQSNIIDKNT
jgi:hypothetical protein